MNQWWCCSACYRLCQMQTWGQGHMMYAICHPEPIENYCPRGTQVLPHMALATPGIGANPRDGKAAAASVTTQLPPCSTGAGGSLFVHCCAYSLVLAFSVQTLHHGAYWFCLLELNFSSPQHIAELSLRECAQTSFPMDDAVQASWS